MSAVRNDWPVGSSPIRQTAAAAQQQLQQQLCRVRRGAKAASRGAVADDLCRGTGVLNSHSLSSLFHDNVITYGIVVFTAVVDLGRCVCVCA
jgi:hypothetical protein